VTPAVDWKKDLAQRYTFFSTGSTRATADKADFWVPGMTSLVTRLCDFARLRFRHYVQRPIVTPETLLPELLPALPFDYVVEGSHLDALKHV
jgi:hypothetical protein